MLRFVRTTKDEFHYHSSINLTAFRQVYKWKWCTCMHIGWTDLFLHPFENRNGTKRDGTVSFCIKSGKGRRKVVSVVGTHCKLKWENLISNWHIKCVQFNFTPKTICATIIMPAIQYRPLSALTLHCRRSHLIRHTQRQSPQSLPWINVICWNCRAISGLAFKRTQKSGRVH